MAHEFNNVLMGIESFASFLVRRKHDPETLNAAQHIQQSLKRGRTITDEILRFPRATPPVMHAIDVGRWLADFMAEAEAVTNGRARFHFPDEPLFVSGDVSQLNQVLSNLMLNARDASPPDAPITITATRATPELAGSSTPCLAITVADRGAGIPAELRERIFEPLFTTKRRGTGLGLAVVHQVVRAHGGVIRLRSEAGAGTEFHVILPLIEKSVAALERHGVARVAIVDDEEVVANALCELLALEGIEAIAITDVRGIAAQVDAFRPDAIVIDHQLRAAAGELGGVPLVVMASHPEGYAEAPDVVYLRKPFDAQQLLAALAKVARKRS
jgi:CheY-like chemotaxis protein